jgi:hypothetical protein
VPDEHYSRSDAGAGGHRQQNPEEQVAFVGLGRGGGLKLGHALLLHILAKGHILQHGGQTVIICLLALDVVPEPLALGQAVVQVMDSFFPGRHLRLNRSHELFPVGSLFLKLRHILFLQDGHKI